MGTTGSKDLPLTPSVTPPAVQTAGTLTVGVDSSHAPFAGKAGNSDSQIIGIDVDVAAMVADQLGLKLQIVDTSGQEVDTLLGNGTIDMAMDVEQSGQAASETYVVGPYLYDGPALFTVSTSATPADVPLSSLTGSTIVAQQGSLSAYTAGQLIGSDNVQTASSLDAAFKELQSGQTTYVAADAVVGSYLALEYPNVACVKILSDPIGVYIGVSPTNTTLASALETALRTCRDNGELNVVLCKWLGSNAASVVKNTQAMVSQAGSTLATTAGSSDSSQAGSGTSATTDSSAASGDTSGDSSGSASTSGTDSSGDTNADASGSSSSASGDASASGTGDASGSTTG
jgi:polar amino acid transport system substrate-binding protein